MKVTGKEISKNKDGAEPKTRYVLNYKRRLRLLELRGNKCQLCGFDNKAALEIHHIDGNSHNNEFSNLVVLCANCHHIIHAGKVVENESVGAESSGGVAQVYKEKPLGVPHVAHVGQQELLRFCLSGVRKHTSIRCDSLLWQNFKRLCKENGWSTCDIVEKLLLGYVGGVMVDRGRSPNLVVQVDAPRIVKRVRRRQLYFADEVESVEVGPADRQEEISCSFCGKAAVGYAEHVGDGRKVFVCAYHRRSLREHPKWKVLEAKVAEAAKEPSK